MSKHTSEPWEIDFETGELMAGGIVLGMVYGAHDYPCCDEDIDEECKANGRLIINAPGLLAACKELRRILLPLDMLLAQAECADEPLPDSAILLRFMGSGASDHVTVGEYKEAIAGADTAIARAEVISE